MKKLNHNFFFKLLFSAAVFAGAGSMSVSAAEAPPQELLTPPSAFSGPMLSDESGISAMDTNDYFPELKEGNYARWIDRIEVPDYAADFYLMLEEGCDNDGIDDFLIDINGSDLVEDVTEYISESGEGTAGRGIKLADITGSGADWEEATTAVYEDFYDKFYKIRAVHEAFDRDRSDVFWLNSGCYLSTVNYQTSTTYDEATQSWICTYTGEVYFMLESEGYDWSLWNINYTTPEQIRADIKSIDAQADSIVSAVADKDPDEQIAYFNEWLTMHNEYNYYVGYGTMDIMDVLLQYPDVFECTSALFGRVGYEGPVCEAYARAMKVLCDKAGIPCVLVDGYAYNGSDGEGESHMWNYVQLDERWYAVDVTWNDPNWGEAGAVSGNETTTYLLIGADTKTQVGYETMRFIDSHPANNQPYGSEGLSFSNGPVLSSNDYVKTFDDISGLDYFYDAVIWAVDRKITSGRTPDTFAPYAECSRADIVTFLYRALKGTPSDDECQFEDIDESEYYYEAMMWAVEQGITQGLTATTFGPYEKCTREQIVTFLWRAMGSQTTDQDVDFTDVEKNSWYYPAVCWALENGVTTGQTQDTFGVLKPCCRADGVLFMQRALGN